MKMVRSENLRSRFDRTQHRQCPVEGAHIFLNLIHHLFSPLLSHPNNFFCVFVRVLVYMRSTINVINYRFFFLLSYLQNHLIKKKVMCHVLLRVDSFVCMKVDLYECFKRHRVCFHISILT